MSDDRHELIATIEAIRKLVEDREAYCWQHESTSAGGYTTRPDFAVSTYDVLKILNGGAPSQRGERP